MAGCPPPLILQQGLPWMPWSIDRDRREETLRQVFRTDRNTPSSSPAEAHDGEEVFGGQRERSRVACSNIGTRKSQYNRPLHEEISRATGGVVGADQLLGNGGCNNTPPVRRAHHRSSCRPPEERRLTQGEIAGQSLNSLNNYAESPRLSRGIPYENRERVGVRGANLKPIIVIQFHFSPIWRQQH